MTQALFFKPSWERLRTAIAAAAPDLDIVLYDEDGRLWRQGREVTRSDIDPAWFWLHSELFFSPRLRDYFQLMLDCPNGRWLHTINTGLDTLPYLELLRQGVSISNNHSQAPAIAEYVFGQLLAHYQDVAGLRAAQQSRLWRWQRFREIAGTHWLLIGFGEIGKEIARRAKAFGARVTVQRRVQDTEGLADAVIPRAGLAEVLPQADVVVLACASNADTQQLVDAAFLAAMKEDSVLVNVARGDLVVEAALRTALDAGRPAFAVLDVFNQEPPPADSWVWEHPRVSLTPHSSNAGSGMRARSDALFLDNLARMVQGRELRNRVSERDIL